MKTSKTSKASKYLNTQTENIIQSIETNKKSILQLNSQYEKILISIKPSLNKSSLVPKHLKITEIFIAKKFLDWEMLLPIRCQFLLYMPLFWLADAKLMNFDKLAKSCMIPRDIL